MRYILTVTLLAAALLCGCGSPAPAAVLVYSANGTYTTKTTLAAAAVAPDAAGKKVVFTTDQTLSANLNWPADRELVPENFAKINHGAYTISYAGSTARWPLAQVFNGTGAVTLSGPGEITPQAFGATATAGHDDLAAINKAIISAATGGTLRFHSGTYNISKYITMRRGDITILGGAGVTINNTNVSAGYLHDGFRCGNSDLADGEEGTNVNPYTYTTNWRISGFHFTGCRLGVAVSRSKNFVVENITANGVGGVGVGNDVTDNCYQFTVRNVTMTGWDLGTDGSPWYVVGIYMSQNFNVDGVYNTAGMTTSAVPVPNSSHVEFKNCDFWSAQNIHIDGVVPFNYGIGITGCDYFTLSDWSAVRCRVGLYTFPEGAHTQLVGTVNPGSIVSSTTGLSVFAKNTTFKGVKTVGCTTDLLLNTDASGNFFDACEFNPLGLAVITEETSGGNNGINLQRWNNCKTGNTPKGIEGNTDGYYGGARTFFRATGAPAAANATGDGTAFTVVGWTEQTDQHSDFDPVTGVFTAPIDGIYQFSGSVGISNQAASGYTSAYLSVYTVSGGLTMLGGQLAVNGQPTGSTVIKMARGETATLRMVATGGTNAATVGPYLSACYFQGMML